MVKLYRNEVLFMQRYFTKISTTALTILLCLGFLCASFITAAAAAKKEDDYYVPNGQDSLDYFLKDGKIAAIVEATTIKKKFERQHSSGIKVSVFEMKFAVRNVLKPDWPVDLTSVQFEDSTEEQPKAGEYLIVVNSEGKAKAAIFDEKANGFRWHGYIIGTRELIEQYIKNPYTRASSVAAGGNFSLAIDRNSNLYAWGENKFGQLGTGDNKNRSKPIKIMSDVAFVYCGEDFVIAKKNDNSIYVWGNNTQGQLGLGDNKSRNKPTKFTIAEMKYGYIETIACGGGHVLALTTRGDLYGWGLNDKGQLGLGHNRNQLKPVIVEKGETIGGPKPAWRIGRIAAGTKSSYFVKQRHVMLSEDEMGIDASELYAFGDNSLGQLGLGDTKPRNKPVVTFDGAYDVFAGYNSAIFVAAEPNKGIYAVGDNQYNQLNIGDGIKMAKIPIAIQDFNGMTNAVIGEKHILISIGFNNGERWQEQLLTFGDNQFGQRGNNLTLSHPDSHIAVMTHNSEGKFTFFIASGKNHNLIVSRDGDGLIEVWGRGTEGQLGDGTSKSTYSVITLTLP